MRFFVVLLLLPALTGCSPEGEQPVQTTTLLISGPEETQVRGPIEVRRFEVTPEVVARGGTVAVNVELAKAIPSRKLAVDWHAPDGWVVAHQELDAGQTRITLAAPVAELEEAGRYRVVLRSGLDSLVEETLSVTR
jgi:hypothetical protein